MRGHRGRAAGGVADQRFSERSAETRRTNGSCGNDFNRAIKDLGRTRTHAHAHTHTRTFLRTQSHKEMYFRACTQILTQIRNPLINTIHIRTLNGTSRKLAGAHSHAKLARARTQARMHTLARSFEHAGKLCTHSCIRTHPASYLSEIKVG